MTNTTATPAFRFDKAEFDRLRTARNEAVRAAQLTTHGTRAEKRRACAAMDEADAAFRAKVAEMEAKYGDMLAWPA